jgi:3-oxoacyl-[acyl-carrier protein] reductase
MRHRVVLVTGASSSIGAAIANKFAAETTTIVFATSRRQPTDVVSSVTWVRGDILTDSEQIVSSVADCLKLRSASAAATERGSSLQRCSTSIDILVNAAGVGQNKLLVRSTGIDMSDVLRTNVEGSLLMTKAALVQGGMMKARSGSVLFMGSVVGHHGNAGQIAYAASKAALIGASLSLVKEYGRYGVRFNVLSPGLVESSGMGAAVSQEAREAWVERCALRRLATVDEVAHACVSLASCSYLNGQSIVLDGGRQ